MFKMTALQNALAVMLTMTALQTKAAQSCGFCRDHLLRIEVGYHMHFLIHLMILGDTRMIESYTPNPELSGKRLRELTPI